MAPPTKGTLARVSERTQKLADLCKEMNEDIKGAYEEIEELANSTSARFKVVDKHLELVDSHETRITWLENRIEKRGRPAKK